MSDRPQVFYEVAKEITIAAIQNGAVNFTGKNNQERAKAIGDLYKSVTKAVNDAMNGDFETTS